MRNDFEKIRQRIEVRSREKMKQRRQNRLRMLTVCVSLVLCIGLGGVYAWQAGWLPQAEQSYVPYTEAMQPEVGTPELEAAQGTTAAIWQEEIVEEVVLDNSGTMHPVTMELSGGPYDTVTAFADSETRGQVEALLQQIQTTDEAGEIRAEGSDALVGILDSAGSYTLTLFGGEDQEFRLQEGVITDLQTGISYRATQQQWQSLCRLLGLR